MSYNEYVTIMAEEVKCPNCEEKDRVTIAGRVFCINCGKPFDDGQHDDLPRPVAPTKPNATSFNTPPNPPSSNPPANVQNANQRAVELQSLMNAEPKIIPANNPKVQNQVTGPVEPTSPLEDFDQLVDISTDSSAPIEQVGSDQASVSADQVQSQPLATASTQSDQSAPAIVSSSSADSTQSAASSTPVAVVPPVDTTTDVAQQSINSPAVVSTSPPTEVPVAVSQPAIDTTNAEPASVLPAPPILAQSAQPSSTQPPLTEVGTTSDQIPSAASQPAPFTPNSAPIASIQPDSSTPTTVPAVAQSIPAEPIAQPSDSVPAPPLASNDPTATSSPSSTPAIVPSPSDTGTEPVATPQPAQPSAPINQPLPAPAIVPPPAPSMTPAAQVLAANTTQIQVPTPPPVIAEAPPAPVTTNQAPVEQPVPIASPIPTPVPAVDQIAPVKSAQPKITKSPISIGKSTTAQTQPPTDGITITPNNGAPLDLKDKSIMSDDAFDKLLNAPSILSDNVKKVETTAHSNVITTAPPPFTPPSTPLTSANIKIVPSQAISDIRPVASATTTAVAAPPPVIPQAPVPQPAQPTPPVQDLPQSPPFTPPPANESVAHEATQPRIMSDIKPASTQLNGAAVLPTDGKLNIHPKHSFMAEPGVASRVGDSAASEQDQSAKEQALKMALSSVGEQPAPQIGVSFKPANVALSLVVVGLLGFYIWQVNYPNLAIKVAASKSGVTATVPGYLPSGWKIGKNINASDGMLSYDAINPSINKNIQIIQARTDWDSQALAENYVAPKYPGYTAFQVQGLTIYMYDDNKASWISNGNWFRIEGQTQALSQDQIIKMATSL